MSSVWQELANEREVPPVSDEWQHQGPHVGSRVSLHFDGLGASEGVVTRYLPSDADEPALWHVVHDDGDEQVGQPCALTAALAATPLSTLRSQAALDSPSFCRTWRKMSCSRLSVS